MPLTRTINNKALSTNITLSASDVGAVATSALGNGTISFTIDGESVGSLLLIRVQIKLYLFL